MEHLDIKGMKWKHSGHVRETKLNTATHNRMLDIKKNKPYKRSPLRNRIAIYCNRIVTCRGKCTKKYWIENVHCLLSMRQKIASTTPCFIDFFPENKLSRYFLTLKLHKKRKKAEE